MRRDPVRPSELQFVRHHPIERKIRVAVLAGHQPDLDVSASFPKTGDGVEARL